MTQMRKPLFSLAGVENFLRNVFTCLFKVFFHFGHFLRRFRFLKNTDKKADRKNCNVECKNHTWVFALQTDGFCGPNRCNFFCDVSFEKFRKSQKAGGLQPGREKEGKRKIQEENINKRRSRRACLFVQR